MRTLVGAYKAREISLPFFAERAGMRVTDAWWRLWQDPGIPIRVRSSARLPQLQDKQILVVDVTALITFALLNLLPALRKRFRLVVSQHVLDAVGEEVYQLRANNLSAIALYNATLDPQKAAALDHARQQHAFFVELRGFIETETERLVSTSWLNLPPAIVEQRERVFGLSGSHSLLVARDHGLSLLVDDSITRELAIREERIMAASSWNVLKELHRAALVTATDLASAEEQLRRVGYDEIEAVDY